MCRRFQFMPASSGGLSRISLLLCYLWWEKQLVLMAAILLPRAQRDDKACKSTLMSSDVLYVLAALHQHKYIFLSHAISAQAQCKHRSISSHTHTHTHTHQMWFQHRINKPVRWWLTGQREHIFSAGSATFVLDILLPSTQTPLKSHFCTPNAVRITDVRVSYWGCHLRSNVSCPAYWIGNLFQLSGLICFCGLQIHIWIWVSAICIFHIFPRWRGGDRNPSCFFWLETSVTLYCNTTTLCFHIKTSI